MVSVDTNVLVRLVIGDDPLQVEQAESFVENGAWVSQLVVTEAMWVLGSVYDFSASEIISALSMLLTHESLIIEDSDTVAAAVELFRSKPKLRFTDCLILEISRKAGHLPLGTFDQGLSKIDGAAKI